MGFLRGGQSMITLNVQYCDSILRHEGGSSYSLIGIYPCIYPLATREGILPRINLCLTFHIPASRADLRHKTLRVEVFKEGEILSAIDMPPPSDDDPSMDGAAFNGVVHQCMENLPVADGEEMHAVLSSESEILAIGNKLKFICDSE